MVVAYQFAHLWLAGTAVVCYGMALVLHIRIVKTVNRSVPQTDRVPYLLHFRDIGRPESEYRRIFPSSKLPRLVLVLVVTAVVFGLAAVGVRAWELMSVR